MVANLTARGIYLKTLEAHSTLKAQRKRLVDHEMLWALSADVDFIWQKWIDEDEKERVEKLEWMDEIEEFVLLAKTLLCDLGLA